MGTSEEVFMAGISLIVSTIAIFITLIGISPVVDFFAVWMGTIPDLAPGWSDAVQPLFPAWYAILLLWFVVSCIWFIKTVFKRTDYTAGYDQPY